MVLWCGEMSIRDMAYFVVRCGLCEAPITFERRNGYPMPYVLPVGDILYHKLVKIGREPDVRKVYVARLTNDIVPICSANSCNKGRTLLIWYLCNPAWVNQIIILHFPIPDEQLFVDSSPLLGASGDEEVAFPLDLVDTDVLRVFTERLLNLQKLLHQLHPDLKSKADCRGHPDGCPVNIVTSQKAKTERRKRYRTSFYDCISLYCAGAAPTDRASCIYNFCHRS
ncbi:hypothetical protein CAPTEDRAFT_185751 [Capitella teleta]|uniref:Uncharacterized protein n=1 Tax=Capitella teleta TaxID=283909 RepID=R7VLH6_CAPTE|nr:hypothetical protein CAPTEDRAFT_185751 [Capitella teleta]|eukprot:ELU18271.1 hypothetical protein CAPTEDRAFT_185751 [Capitella teleta]